MKFKAALPNIQSAILIGGGEGDCVKVKLDAYLSGEQIEELAKKRGRVFSVEITDTEATT